jgi:hypothetical protein
MLGDSDDFPEAAPCLEQHSYGGAPDVVKVQGVNARRPAGLIPLAGKVLLTPSESRLRRQDDSGTARSVI